MKLTATGMPQSAFVSPLESMVVKPWRQTVGAGIGVDRLDVGFNTNYRSSELTAMAKTSISTSDAEATAPRGKTEKRRRWDNQALGETPPRDGPFTAGAARVAQDSPTRAIQKKSSVARKKRSGISM
jgi:hypothetical protein